MAQDERSKIYINRFRELKQDRTLLDEKWKDIREHIFPGSGMFADHGDKPHDGDQHNERIIDGLAIRAHRIAAAGMQGGLTSPSRPWFRLGLEDKEMEAFRPVKTWLETVEKRMYSVFASSNFYNSIHQVYQEELAYGGAVLFELEHPRNVVYFVPLTIGEYYLVANQYNQVDSVYRTVWYQANQLYEKFGEVLPHDVRKDVTDENGNPFRWYRVLNIVQPRGQFTESKKDSGNMPFESVHVLLYENNPLLRKSGFNERPFFAPRWSVRGTSAYGRGPGHEALPDVKMLQTLSGDFLEGLEKMVRPPLKSGAGLQHEVSHLAGLVTYADGQGADSIKPIFEVQLNIGDLVQARDDARMQVREGFYNDLFLMLIEPTPGMTATEVAERQQEKLLMLGPVIERQFHELLDPTIDRTFAVMERKGMIPPPPKELVEAAKSDPALEKIQVRYISLLAQAQKLITTQSIKAVSDYVGGIAQIVPDAVDKLDADQAVDEFAASVGAPVKIVRSEDMVKQIREEKAKQMAQAQQMQQGMAQAETAKTLSETDLSGESALTAMRDNLEAY